MKKKIVVLILFFMIVVLIALFFKNSKKNQIVNVDTKEVVEQVMDDMIKDISD